MHDNRRLTYMDPRSFLQVPQLQELRLHNNNLLALGHDLAISVPQLQLVTLYNNPLHCDCNVHWIKASLLLNSTNSNVSFPELGQLHCYTPIRLSGQLLLEVPLSAIPATCPPTVLPFFNDSSQVELGERVLYECHALGSPQPHIHWILANGKVLNNTSNYSRVRLSPKGLLTLIEVKASDAGTYTCVATNALGYDSSSTVLQIHNKDIHILHKGIATNFITVTWNGTASTVLTSDYLILYRQAGSAQPYGRIHVRPYMRTYTITNLQPHTAYEFCMAYEHRQEVVKLHCVQLRTKHAMYSLKGIHTLGSSAILIALSTTAAFITTVCLTVFFLKRYMRRRAYKEPEGAPVEPSLQQLERMSQIPLDNLYNPPSTPLCSSRTSLIGQSRA